MWIFQQKHAHTWHLLLHLAYLKLYIYIHGYIDISIYLHLFFPSLSLSTFPYIYIYWYSSTSAFKTTYCTHVIEDVHQYSRHTHTHIDAVYTAIWCRCRYKRMDLSESTGPKTSNRCQAHLNAFVPPASNDWSAHEWRRGDFVRHFAGCPWQEPRPFVGGF